LLWDEAQLKDIDQRKIRYMDIWDVSRLKAVRSTAGIRDRLAYVTTKTAVVRLTKALAMDQAAGRIPVDRHHRQPAASPGAGRQARRMATGCAGCGAGRMLAPSRCNRAAASAAVRPRATSACKVAIADSGDKACHADAGGWRSGAVAGAMSIERTSVPILRPRPR